MLGLTPFALVPVVVAANEFGTLTNATQLVTNAQLAINLRTIYYPLYIFIWE